MYMEGKSVAATCGIGRDGPVETVCGFEALESLSISPMAIKHFEFDPQCQNSSY